MKESLKLKNYANYIVYFVIGSYTYTKHDTWSIVYANCREVDRILRLGGPKIFFQGEAFFP